MLTDAQITELDKSVKWFYNHGSDTYWLNIDHYIYDNYRKRHIDYSGTGILKEACAYANKHLKRMQVLS